MYSFSDQDAYAGLVNQIKAKAEYAGFAMFDTVKREYYFDGKTCYCFYTGPRKC